MTVKLNLVSCTFLANVSATLGASSPFTERAAFGVSDDGSVDDLDIGLRRGVAARRSAVTENDAAPGRSSSFVRIADSRGLTGPIEVL